MILFLHLSLSLSLLSKHLSVFSVSAVSRVFSKHLPINIERPLMTSGVGCDCHFWCDQAAGRWKQNWAMILVSVCVCVCLFNCLASFCQLSFELIGLEKVRALAGDGEITGNQRGDSSKRKLKMTMILSCFALLHLHWFSRPQLSLGYHHHHHRYGCTSFARQTKLSSLLKFFLHSNVPRFRR